MTEMLLRIFLLILIITSSSAWAGEKKLTPDAFNRYNKSFIKADSRGNIWTAYYDLKGGIHIRNITENRDLIVNEGREGLASGLAFDIQGEHAYVVWREKTGSKKLFFRVTHDGGMTLSEPVLLDDNSTEALSRMKIGSNSKGDVYVTWYGEKQVGNATHHLYITGSNDFGRSFSDIKNLTKGYVRSIYPIILVDEEAAYVFAYSSKEGGRRYMVFRRTDDRGKSWSEPLEIKEIGSVTRFIEPVRIGKRLHVFWFNGYDDFQIVEGAYSDDGGKTWITKTFEDTKGFDLGTLRVAHDQSGHIYLAVYGHWKDNEKNNVYIIRSEDNGTTWQDMTPLRRYPSQLTQAKKPDIMATEGGEVVAVWVDFRNIRRNLYMQYSKDFGRTWQEKDIPLEEPGRFNTGHYVYTDSLTKVKDKYYVLAYRFRGDLVMVGEADLLLLDFKLDAEGAR